MRAPWAVAGARVKALTGILNGIDYEAWDPARDPTLPCPFSRTVIAGTRVCKTAAQQEVGLDVRPDVSLIAILSRIAHQKMADVVLEALPGIMKEDVQVALVGEGDLALERAFESMADRYPQRLAVRIGYQECAAHRLQAGADILLHPSRFQAALSHRLDRPVSNAFVEKYRAGGVVRGEALVGDVKGRVAIIIDDLISTGGTLTHAARACRAQGATRVFAAATHGLFVGKSEILLNEPALDGLVVTDTVPPCRLPGDAIGKKVTVLASAPLVAEAIRRIHEGGSLVELLQV